MKIQKWWLYFYPHMDWNIHSLKTQMTISQTGLILWLNGSKLNVISVTGFWTVLELIHGSIVGSSSYSIFSSGDQNRYEECKSDFLN